MKTLLFATSFTSSEDVWKTRYLKWLKHSKHQNIDYTQMMLIDDGSPVLPNWSDVEIVNTPFDGELKNKKYLIHFPNNLGRPSMLDYPGWFRSFQFAAKYAKKFNFDKIIHIESDAFLLTDKIVDFINNLQSGWCVFWCHYHNFPENAIQVICRDQIDTLYNSVNISYNKSFKNKIIENCLPYTSIVKHFKGDRYFEYTIDIPKDADYVCQYS